MKEEKDGKQQESERADGMNHRRKEERKRQMEGGWKEGIRG